MNILFIYKKKLFPLYIKNKLNDSKNGLNNSKTGWTILKKD